MYTIDNSSPVLVTGASGYIAGWIVKRLLEAGVTVHAAVRDTSNTEKLAHLTAMAEDSPGQIVYFGADLLDDGAYAKAMEGCEVVIHTASPFFLDVKDPQKELIDPAVGGVRNVLRQASRTESVKRVVLTSSCAAIYGDSADVQHAPGGILTEECWNTSSSPTHNPYSYSKTAAEKEAWSLAGKQTAWDLVVINPSLVLGPGTNPHANSESYSFMIQVGDGSLKNGVPHWEIGVVDVRDVAEAHIAAAYTPEARGRHIVSGEDASFLGIVAPIVEKFGDQYPLPRRTIPKWLIWLIGPFVASYMTRKGIARNVGYRWRADNSKSIRELGMTYRPLEETVTEFFQYLIDSERLSPKKG